MQNYKKYQRGYFLPPVPSNEWVKKDYIEKAPIWCSVDLRDGNQALIENDMIPQDVTIQVLTQAREHIIRKTFEAIKGAPNVVVHLYNSTSVAQREQVFKKSKEEIMKIAVDGAKLLEELAQGEEGNITFEYSPESFHGTEVDYALDVCNAVLDVWQPRPDRKIIVNIPACPMYLPARSSTSARTSNIVTTWYFPSIRTTTEAAAWLTQSWAYWRAQTG